LLVLHGDKPTSNVELFFITSLRPSKTVEIGSIYLLL